VLATEIGGRRASAQVRRGFVAHREHEIASKVSRRLRKRETRLGKVLTVIKNASRRRIAFGVDLGDVFLGESLCDRLGDWSRGSRGSGGRYLKEQTCGARIACANRARWVRPDSCPTRTEVGDGPDLWVPPGSDSGRGTCLSVEGERRALALSCWAGCWCLGRNREERGKGRSRPRGGKEKWAEPETGRERGNSFPFSKFCFPFSFKTKHISKPNLNSF
jgi:hypothetical protein